MLIVNGALAVLNGLLVATGRIWCECVRGGVCCGGECRCDEGVCCDEVWHTDLDPDEPCEEGEVFLQWCQILAGGGFARCGCVPATIYDPRVDDDVNTADLVDELCCCPGPLSFGYDEEGNLVGCTQRCCTDGACTNEVQGACGGESLANCCEDLGCPKSCCTEDSSGGVLCDTVDELLCAGVVDTELCATACKGTCCGLVSPSSDEKTGEPTGELVTQAECEELGGCWQGIGTVLCEVPLDGGCRAPYDEDCCQSVVSSAERLTFTGPRKRRCPELHGCSTQVTVEVTTGSPVYIHGGLFGAPYEACTDEVTFVLCNDQFHVTPAPCSGNLQGVNIKTCWEEGSGDELLRFRCCQDITHLIGNCDCDCVTTVLYEEEGCTSNAAFIMRGNATIDASGTGALVLTSNITHGNSCARTLTLTGSNQDNNELSGVIENGSGTSVAKTGVGVWRLSGANTYANGLTVLDGTLLVAANAGTSGASPFGTGNPIVGSTAAGISGTAALLLENGVLSQRGITVAAAGVGSSQVKVIGGRSNGVSQFSVQNITLNDSVTLQAAPGGTVTFANPWANGNSYVVTIGSAGNDGTVGIEQFLPATLAAVNVVNGLAEVFQPNIIDPSTPVTVGSSLGSAVLNLNSFYEPVSQTLSDLTFAVGSGSITGSTLRLTGTVATTGTGHAISSAVALDAAVTFSGSGELTISGIVSGSGSLTKSGSGTLTLSGASTYTGTTTVSSGTLLVTGSIDDGNVVSVSSGATYFVGSTDTVGSIAGAGSIVLGSSFTLTAGGLDTSTTYSGVMSGAGNFAKTGSGTLTLSGANTYTGTTTVSGGTLLLSGSLEPTSQIFIGNATLECTGSTKLANAVEITGTATQKGSMTVGTLSGSGSLTHDGGTLTLTNASALTGTITVASGSLVLNAIVSGGSVTSATFTSSALTVDFSSAPSSGNQFVLLAGPTGGTYGTVTLTNAGGATGTYDSATSTLTID